MYQIHKALSNLQKMKKKSSLISIEDKKIISSTIDLLEKAELKLEEQREQYCHWLQQDGENSEDWLACDDKIFCLTNGTPSENGMRFCPYCGKNLVEITYAEQFPSDEESEDENYEYI